LESNFVIFQRGAVISGLYEPTDLECKWDSGDEKEQQLNSDVKNKLEIEEVDTAKNQDNE